MSDLDITGRVVFDASQAEGALDKIGDKADQMAREVQGAAAAAGKSVDKIGDGAAGSAEKFTRAEARIADSIKRTQTSLELLGKTASEKLEFKINAQGLDAVKFEPALAKLRETEQAALKAGNAASASLGQIGISAKQTAAALRGVPAQFTDIVTSIQGGQAPLTVFLQQGGQLKDMFGGAGNAAKAFGGYVVGLINPLTLAVGAVGALGYAAYKASEDAKALNKALILSNGATGASITDLNNYERALVKSGIASSTATAALVEFVGAGVKATAGLQEITKAAIDLEKVGGAAVKDTAKAFAELAKDPLSSLQTLTLETYKQVQALSDQGDQLGAVAVAQQAYKESIELQTVALKAQEGPLDVAIRSWKSYGTAISEAGRSLATAVLGTPQTGNEQRAQLQQRRDTYSAQGYDTTKEDAQLAYFKRLDDAQKQSIANQQRDLELKNLLDKFNRDDTAGKKQRELNQGITDYSKLLESGQITATQYAAAIKKLSEVKGAGAKSQITDDIKGLNLYNDLLSKSAGYSANYAENVGLLSAAFAKGRIDLDGLKEAMKQLNSEQQINKDAAKAQEDQLKAVAKAQEAYVNTQLKSIEAAEKSAKSAGDTLQKYVDEEQALTLAAAKNISLAQAIAEVELARLREAQTAAIASKANDGVLLALDEEIKKREQIVQAIGRKESREAVDKSAKEAAADWKKAAEQIEQSITDALFRGFESGKGFGENLRDTLVNTFKTMVLRPVISASVQGGLSALGMGSRSGGGGGGGLLSSLGGAYSAYQASGSLSAGFASLFGGGTATALSGYGTTAATGYGASGVIAGGNLGVGAGSGAAAGGASSGLAAIPVAGWIAMGMLASSDAYDEGYRANTDFSNPIKAVLDPNTVLDLTDGLLQSLGIDGKTASILSGSALGAKLADFLSGGGDYVQSLGESVATVVGKTIGLGGSGGTNDVSIGGGLNIRQTEQSDKFTGGLASAFVKAASALGIATSGATFGAGFNNSDGGKFAVEATVGGAKYDPGQVKTTDANLALEASRAVFFALQSSELPGYLSKVFDGITASTAAQADIDAALAYAGSLKQIRDALTETRTPLQVLQDSVSSAFTALGTSADTFKTDFVKAIDAGISPDSLAQYLALGQNLDALAAASGTASTAVTEVARSLGDIANERKSLQAELDSLTLSSADLLAKQRNALDESNRSLFDQVQAAQQAKTANEELAEAQRNAAETLAEAISTAQGAQAQAVQRFTAPLNAASAGALLGGNAVTAIQGKSSAEIREMARAYVASLDAQTQAGREAITQFEKQAAAVDFFANAADEAAQTIKDAANTTLQAAKDQTAGAFAGVQRAIDAQRRIAQTQLSVAGESVSALKNVFDTLAGGVKSLYDSAGIDNTANATSFLQQALATAQATGYLPDATQLADAVSAAVNGTQGGQYASQADAEFAKLALAGTLTGLKDITGSQLTSAEQAVKLAQRQLDTLDDTLKTAQDQLDALNGVDNSVQSVANAIASLTSAIAAQNGAQAAAQVAASTGSVAQQAGLQPNASTGSVKGAGGLLAAANSYTDAEVLSALAISVAQGYSAADLIGAAARNFGVGESDIRRVARAGGIPGFAVGTNYVPNDMLALVHQGEAIVPAAYNPANGGSGSSRTDALIEGLTAEVKRLQEVVAIGNANTRRTAEAVNGNPDAPMLVTTA